MDTAETRPRGFFPTMDYWDFTFMTTSTLGDLPFYQAQDLSGIPVVDIARKIEAEYGLVKDWPAPHNSAALFYLQNHWYATLSRRLPKHEPIPVEHRHKAFTYHNFLLDETLRAFFYLIIICTREVRHSHYSQDAMYKHCKLRVGHKDADEFSKFYRRIGCKESLEAMSIFFDNPPEMELGKYIECLETAFLTGFDAGYGGMAWHKIAAPLSMAVNGFSSLFTLLDTTFTLEHNNGAIFNKGYLYKAQENPRMIKILDLQRAGFIPSGLKSKTITVDTYDAIAEYVNIIPAMLSDLDEWEGVPAEVDWLAVHHSGAVGSYQTQIDKQLSAINSMLPNAVDSHAAMAKGFDQPNSNALAPKGHTTTPPQHPNAKTRVLKATHAKSKHFPSFKMTGKSMQVNPFAKGNGIIKILKRANT